MKIKPFSSVKSCLFLFFIILEQGCGKIAANSNLLDGLLNTSSTRFSVSGPSTVSLGQCSPLIISLQKTSGESVVPTSQFTASLQGLTTAEIFTDSSCLTMVTGTDISWAAGTASKLIYVKPSSAQIYTLQVTDSLAVYSANYFVLNVSASASVALRLSLSGSTSFLTGQCKSYVVSLQDSNGSLQTRTSNTTVNLSGQGAGNFKAGSSCAGGNITSVVIPSGSSVASFSFSNATAESLVFTVDAGSSGVTSTFMSVQVQSSVAYQANQLVMTGPSAGTAGACTGPVLVKALDSFGNIVAANGDIPFSLIGSLGFQAYVESSCTTPLISPKIADGTSAMNYYFITSGGGSLSVNADDAGPLLDSAMTVAMTASMSGTATKLAITGPTTITVGSCSSAFLVRSQDGSSVDYPVASITTVNLTGSGTGVFYSDSGCTAAITSVSFAVGNSSKSFYYKNNSTASLVFNGDNGGSLTPGSLSLNVVAGPPTQLTLSGPTSINSGDCRAYIAQALDTNSFASPLSSAKSIQLTGGGSGLFYSDGGCASTTTSTTINSGQSSAVFYYKSNSVQSLTLAIDDIGVPDLTAANLGVTVVAGVASRIGWSVSSSVPLAGQCVTGTLQIQDVLGNPVVQGSNATVALSGLGASQFFTTADCTTGAVTSLTILTGQSAISFSMKDNTAQALVVSATTAGLPAANQNFTVNSGAPNLLRLIGPATASAGDCSAYDLRVDDSLNNLSNVIANTTVNFSGVSAGSFYSDASCTAQISSSIFLTGASLKTIYYKNLTSEAITLAATASGLTAASKALTVNALAASQLVVAGSNSAAAGSCNLFTVSVKDSLGNLIPQGSNLTVNLTGSGNGLFYSDAGCTATTTTATVLAAASSTTFRFKSNIPESLSFTMQASALTDATKSFVVNAGSPNLLRFAGSATTPAGECTAYDLRVEDTLNNLTNVVSNTTVSLSGVASGQFFSDASCTSQITNSIFLTGSSLKTIYYKNIVAESLTLAATASGLTAASKAVTVNALAASQLTVVGSSSGAAASCNTFTVSVKDSYGNLIPQGSNLTVNLTGSGNGLFYSDAGCAATTTTATVLSAASSAQFRFKSSVPESLNFTMQASGLTDATKSFVVNPQTPTKLVASGPTAIVAGVCSNYSITIQDTLNNLSPVGSSKTVNLSTSGTGSFYSDSGCNSITSNLTFSSSQTTAQVYFKTSSAQSLNLIADDLGLPDLASTLLGVTVSSSGGASSTVLRLNGSASINTLTCVPYAVMTTDSSGTSINVSSPLTVTLSGEGSGTFYSNSNCSTTSSTVVIGTGTSLGYIYYKNSSAENLIFAATAPSASTTTFPLAVVGGASAGAASKLVMTGNSAIITGNCIPYIISLTDINGNTVNAGANTAMTLSGGGAGVFYTDSNCTADASGAATITNGTSYQTVYYKNATAQNLIFVAQSAGLSNSTLSVAVSGTSGGSTAGPAVKLSFISQPSTVATVNVDFASQPTVIVQDSNNNVVDASNAAITLAAYSDAACTTLAGGTLNATTNPMNASGGIASFTGVNETNTQTIYLKATSAGLAAACSTAVQVYPSVPTKLSFSVHPSATATAGSDFSTQPQVSILNNTNQVMTSSTNSITLSAYTDSTCTSAISSGTFSVTTNPILPTSGVATFAGVKYTEVSTIYLKATSPGLTSACSTGIVISPAAANQLSFYLAPPQNATAGTSFPVQVSIKDVYGNTAPISDSIVLTGYASNNCTGGVIGGFTGGSSTAASLGTASFAAVTETVAGVFTILATDATNGLVISACSSPINVTGGAGTTLSYTVQPASTGFAYTNLLTSPIVQVTDTYGNLVTTANNSVAIAAYTDSGCTAAAGGTLVASTNPVSPNAGIATFSGVSYSSSGTIYLRASSSGLVSACSNAVVIAGSVSQIATGDKHTCAISNSNVYCWGANDYGQFGNGTTMLSANNPVQTVGVGGTGYLSGIVGIAAGYRHTCAVSGAGAVYCWGWNATYNQLGDNTSTNRLTPVQVVGVGGTGFLTGIKQIAIGSSAYGHTCALSTANEVYCWGYNGYGQLGDNTTTQRAAPVKVTGVGGTGFLSNITNIAAGGTYGHTCAVNSTGSVYCWGYGANGQLGDNTSTTRNAPVQVTGVGGTGFLANAATVAVGGTSGSTGHTCALTTTGTVYCWGYNNTGQLGDNTITGRPAPVQVLGVGAVGFLSNITAIAAGGGTSNNGTTCAVNSSGSMFCWGDNTNGKLGDNTATQRNTPVQVVGSLGLGFLSNIYTLSVSSSYSSYGHVCAVSTTGSVNCFGNNSFGQLGNGTSNVATQSSPVQTWQPGSVAFTQISASNGHSCGISGGAVYCWGANGNGELGDGTTTARATPVQVKGVGNVGYLSGIISVSVTSYGGSSYSHTCAVSGSGAAYCWGANANGQLGNGTTTGSSYPVQVSGLTNAISIEVGGSYSSNSFSCAVTSTGSAYCWGYNGYNQLGDGTTTQRTSPVQVVGVGGTGYLSGVTAITIGSEYVYGHACAIASGAAYCWGNNNGYQLGDGTATQRAYPTAVVGMGSGVTAISGGNGYNWTGGQSYTCAVKSGAGYCWGDAGNFGTTPTVRWASGVTGIATGRNAACAIVNGRVDCNHWNASNIANGIYLNNVIQISNKSTYSSAGVDTMCALVSGGSVYCWGYSSGNSQLGNNSTSAQSIPWMITSPIPSGLSISSISAGSANTCAVGNGGVNCWGQGTNGVLGNGSTAQVVTTSSVLLSGTSNNLSAMATVTGGGTHTCSLSSGGSVYCWGDNLFGDLGNNSTTQSTKAVQVTGQGGIGTLSGITSLASGFHHNCAVGSAGAVYCWGWDGHGQLGNNSTISAAVPTKVVGVGGTGYLSGFTKVVAGYAHSCAIDGGGEVYCWGNNQYGQLGNNSTSQSNTPVKVVSVSGTGTLTGVTALAAGSYHTCAISGGQVFCWGANDTNQLGNSLSAHSSYPQGTLNSGYVGLTGAVSITAGANFSCAVLSAGGAMCWGAGANGQLGSNSTLSQNVAMPVVGVGAVGELAGMASIQAGSTGYHTCALNTLGTAMYCWGAGGVGQMGNGSTPSAQLTPVQSTVANVGISYFIAR